VTGQAEGRRHGHDLPVTGQAEGRRHGHDLPVTEDLELSRSQRRRAQAQRTGEGAPQEGVEIFRSVDQAVLVALHRTGTTTHDVDASLDELELLVDTAGGEVVGRVVQKRDVPDVATFVGRGKVAELKSLASQLGADAAIFDDELSPAQQRNLEERLGIKVLDRNIVILDIFAQHATSRDGKLQVELAQLKYALPRLVEKNTMMSRLTGGIGGRGPGETKLEIGRRRARERIRLLEKRQIGVAAERRLRRQRRGERAVPIVGIVGYTNAGKSTLLNALTEGNALAEDKLFATLDPISRRLRFPREREVVLTDTVGFIRDLPADLVAAFRATLEELADADLLVQVVDLSDDDHEQHVAAVTSILADLELAEKPRLLAGNKTDRLAPAEAARRASSIGAIPLSALDRASLTPLLAAIERDLWKEGRATAAVG